MCGPGCWDEGELRRMMNAEEVNIMERISMTRTVYSLKLETKEHPCRWSNR